MGFRRRVDPPSSALFSCLWIMILRVNTDCPGWGRNQLPLACQATMPPLYYASRFGKYCFCSDKSPFCGATGTLWYSLFRTSVVSARGFHSQGGCIIACTLLSLAHNDPQSQLWIPRPRPSPNFTPWYSEATTRVTIQCHFWDCWQRQNSNPGPHCPKPDALPTELSQLA